MPVAKRLRSQWDWIVGYALLGLAAVVLIRTWTVVSGSRYLSDQLSSIVSGGFGGLALLGLGSVLIITAGLSDEWRKLNRVEDAFSFRLDEPPTEPQVLVRPGRIVAATGMLVAVAFLVPVWVRVSGHADPKPGLVAIPWAVVGLIVGGLIAALATMRIQRRVQQRKRRLFTHALATIPDAGPGPVEETTFDDPDGPVLVAPELTRFHRPGCSAVTGLAVRPVDRQQIPIELEPCELCEADTVTREDRTWTSVAG